MKRILVMAAIVGMLLIQFGCKSEGGTDPQKRAEKININVN